MEVGVQPVTIAGIEALSAMQNGTIDGHITTDSLYIDYKQSQAAPYATYFNISCYTYILGANRQAWEALSPDTQAAMETVMKNFQADIRSAMTAAGEISRAEIQKQAKQVTTLTPEQQAAWEATARAVWDRYVADNPTGRSLLDAALAARD